MKKGYEGNMEIKNFEIEYASNEILLELPGLESVNQVENTTNLKLKQYMKRGIDIVGSILGLLLLLPLTIGVYIANLIAKENGPLFYSQERIGKNGRKFKMYKFRTMIVGADKKLEEMLRENEELRIEFTKYKKLKNDPRITQIGKILRKTSLDEFPQFINVLKGEMSLVGPRPYLPKEKDEMGNYYDYIIKCKPGLTGYWQANGRNSVTFDNRLKMDLEYWKSNSLILDLQLLNKTVKNVIKKEGAV